MTNTTKVSRDDLISQLVDDLPSETKPIRIMLFVFGWLLLSWLLVSFPILWGESLRPNLMQQLLSNARFLVETVLGLGSIFILCLAAMKSAIPAGSGRSFWLAGAVISALWILNYIVGMFAPAMEASMAGKREHCVWETLAYGLVPLFLGLFLVSRCYVLNGPLTGLGIGLAAGFIPAWFMQLACMYDAKHGLLMHIGPALIVGLLGALLGWIWLNTKTFR